MRRHVPANLQVWKALRDKTFFSFNNSVRQIHSQKQQCHRQEEGKYWCCIRTTIGEYRLGERVDDEYHRVAVLIVWSKVFSLGAHRRTLLGPLDWMGQRRKPAASGTCSGLWWFVFCLRQFVCCILIVESMYTLSLTVLYCLFKSPVTSPAVWQYHSPSTFKSKGKSRVYCYDAYQFPHRLIALITACSLHCSIRMINDSSHAHKSQPINWYLILVPQCTIQDTRWSIFPSSCLPWWH